MLRTLAQRARIAGLAPRVRAFGGYTQPPLTQGPGAKAGKFK